MRTIPARTVSRPTDTAVNLTAPMPFTVPVYRWSPSSFSTGTASPVSIDSSTAVVPSVISPSTGTRSPGRNTIVSPLVTSAISILVGSPFRMITAVAGCKPISFLIASEVLPRALASSHRPSSMRPIIAADTSKYVPVECDPPTAAPEKVRESSNIGRSIVTATL